LEILRSQMLSPIPAASVTSLRQLAVKMEKILLVALENYGNTFVEPKVELGARFGHLVSEYSANIRSSCAVSYTKYF
jgi:regulatory factor X